MRPAKTLDEMERNVDAMNELHRVTQLVNEHRAKLLAKPAPRSECPGCFSAIYDLARKDGWCWDCNPENPRRVDSRGSRG